MIWLKPYTRIGYYNLISGNSPLNIPKYVLPLCVCAGFFLPTLFHGQYRNLFTILHTFFIFLSNSQSKNLICSFMSNDRRQLKRETRHFIIYLIAFTVLDSRLPSLICCMRVLHPQFNSDCTGSNFGQCQG